MTVLEKKAASGVDLSGVARYVAVGALSVAIGVGIGLGINRVSDAGHVFDTPAQQAMAMRGAAVGENLDSIWQTGLAQQKAISDAALLQNRINAGLAQKQAIHEAQAPRRAMEMRGAAMADHLDSLIHTGAVAQDLYREGN